MLDIGWSEILLIAVVAIVVIGPKDLPDALRTLGRMVNKVRRMAGEFQGQFNQAIREANLEDVKKDFDELRQSASLLKGGLNPVTLATSEIAGAITGASAASTSSSASASASSSASSSTIDPALTSSSAVAAAAASSAAPAAPESQAEPADEAIPSAFATSPSFRPRS